MIGTKTFRILGKFGKGIERSVSVNFSRSGGRNCARKCRHHPRSTAPKHLRTNACYAVTIEARPDRQPLTAKLARHEEIGAVRVVNQALLELQMMDEHPPWLRISTGGSVPERPGKLLVSALRGLLTYCRDCGIPVHFPVETAAKARRYRAIVGDLCQVRESIQDPKRNNTAEGAVSMVAGADIDSGANIRERRIEAARAMADERRQATGRKTIVCPAIVAGWRLKTTQAKLTGARRRQDAVDVARLSNEVEQRKASAGKSKCGACKACALDCDIVYPLH